MMKRANLGLNLPVKCTRKRECLEEMQRAVPWSELTGLIEPQYPNATTARPPMGIAPMPWVHFLPQWFGLSDPVMKEAPYDVPLYSEFADLAGPMRRLPDESTILRFRHLLEERSLAAQIRTTVNGVLQERELMLKSGTVVDAALISTPSSPKNKTGAREPEMRQAKKGNNWYFGMKADIGADADSGLVHTVIGTPANTNDVTQAEALLHGEEVAAFGDAGYQGGHNRVKSTLKNWHIAMRPGKRRALDLNNPKRAMRNEIERLKASVRAKVKHPFRVIEREFGFTKARYRGPAKNPVLVTARKRGYLPRIRRPKGSTINA